jgi:methylenetetrahydrofolate dehydrogenase (NADP+) / methenyltetrahydrofolate cyclohydrolase
MSALRLDGLLIAQMIRRELFAAVSQTTAVIGRPPCLAVVQVEGDRSSDIYVRTKRRAAESCGMHFRVHLHSPSATTEMVMDQIALLNRCDLVDGIIAQLPFPSHICQRAVLAAVSPTKDVDGMHPLNVASALNDMEVPFMPCTALGIKILLDQYNIMTEGKRAVVVGRGAIAGRPIAMMLGHGDATVTVCHKKTQDLKTITSSADILVSATGSPALITANHVKPGAVVIDVGAAFNASGRLVGDTTQDVAAIASAMTPVPGGVGPMTVVGLLLNTFHAYARIHGVETQNTKESLRFCSVRPHGLFKNINPHK